VHRRNFRRRGSGSPIFGVGEWGGTPNFISISRAWSQTKVTPLIIIIIIIIKIFV